MNKKSHTMSESMSEIISITGVCDDVTCTFIDIRTYHARFHNGKCCKLCLKHGIIHTW